MASIATGIDFHTGGYDTSTGAKMRTYTDDQSGGTDSGDAKQSWDRGYDQTLIVRDGNGWDQVLADLRAGRLVNLDVWHATVGGPCLSGSGQYGHNMAVLPDCSEGAWLVADPWCKPGSWVRVSESKLKAGAEDWGRRVYGYAVATRGPLPPELEARARILAAVARELMNRYYPGHPAYGDAPPPVDTGGPPPVLFTVTRAQPLEGSDMGTQFTVTSPPIGKATTKQAIGLIPPEGGEFVQVEAGYVRNVYDTATVVDGKYAGSAAYLVMMPQSDKSMGLLLASAADYVPSASPTPTDCDAVLSARDRQWEEAMRNGDPWPTA